MNKPAKVLGIFEKAVNIWTEDGILTIAPKETGRSSSCLTVNHINIPGLSINVNCDCRPGQISLHTKTIDFSAAPVWHGRIDRAYKQKPAYEGIRILKAALDRSAAKNSAKPNPGAALQLLNGIKNLPGDPEGSVPGLIGLGPGLTPSGDDMILGFLAAINHFTDDEAYLNRLHNVVAAALGATTELSAQILKNALEYEYHEYIEDMLIALAEPATAHSAAARLLSMGSTSGTDIGTGMIKGVISCTTLQW